MSDKIIGQPADGFPADEESHFTICPGCGTRIDMRDLEAVLEHTQHGEGVPFTLNGQPSAPGAKQ